MGDFVMEDGELDDEEVKHMHSKVMGRGGGVVYR